MGTSGINRGENAYTGAPGWSSHLPQEAHPCPADRGDTPTGPLTPEAAALLAVCGWCCPPLNSASPRWMSLQSKELTDLSYLKMKFRCRVYFGLPSSSVSGRGESIETLSTSDIPLHTYDRNTSNSFSSDQRWWKRVVNTKTLDILFLLLSFLCSCGKPTKCQISWWWSVSTSGCLTVTLCVVSHYDTEFQIFHAIIIVVLLV